MGHAARAGARRSCFMRGTTAHYRGTSLISNSPLLGPYSRSILRDLKDQWWPWGGGGFLVSEVHFQEHPVGLNLWLSGDIDLD